MRRHIQDTMLHRRRACRTEEVLRDKTAQAKATSAGRAVARTRMVTQDCTILAAKGFRVASSLSIKSSVRRERREGERPMETVQPSAQVFFFKNHYSTEIHLTTRLSFIKNLFEIGTKQRVLSQRKKAENGTLFNHQKSTKEWLYNVKKSKRNPHFLRSRQR